MIEIVKAEIRDIPIIQELSNIVWPVTFADILSKDQIKYMMNMMYSAESLTNQMQSGHQYVLAKEGDKYLGYLSTQSFDDLNCAKVHKIYVLPDAQGKGVGKHLIEYAKQVALEKGFACLTLNVNRYNKTLDFYIHLGFSIAGTEDIDIGNGFLMEDYVLKMNL